MPFTTAVILIAFLDVAIVAALIVFSLIPFRLDRRRADAAAPVRRIGSADLLEVEDAAA